MKTKKKGLRREIFGSVWHSPVFFVLERNFTNAGGPSSILGAQAPKCTPVAQSSLGEHTSRLKGHDYEMLPRAWLVLEYF